MDHQDRVSQSLRRTDGTDERRVRVEERADHQDRVPGKGIPRADMAVRAVRQL